LGYFVLHWGDGFSPAPMQKSYSTIVTLDGKYFIFLSNNCNGDVYVI